VDVALTSVRGLVVEAETVRGALADMHAVYEQLKPFERKQLMRLVLNRVEVNERQIVLEIHGGVCAGLAQTPIKRSVSRSVAANWLPGQDSNLQPIG
jgi:hypothetical protein